MRLAEPLASLRAQSLVSAKIRHDEDIGAWLDFENGQDPSNPDIIWFPHGEKRPEGSFLSGFTYMDAFAKSGFEAKGRVKCHATTHGMFLHPEGSGDWVFVPSPLPDKTGHELATTFETFAEKHPEAFT